MRQGSAAVGQSASVLRLSDPGTDTGSRFAGMEAARQSKQDARAAAGCAGSGAVDQSLQRLMNGWVRERARQREGREGGRTTAGEKQPAC